MHTSYDIFDNLEPSKIYLAKPGKRIISALPGIREDTCRLERNFNNTSVLEFTVDRDLSGEINPLYELVGQHYELKVDGYGWFKINELPTIESDGNVETKSVRAESLEIELQQYDLVNFEINTASVSSKEMLATDNTFKTEDGYTMFRDQVLFYRDTTKIDELYNQFISGTGTISSLESYLYDYPEILESWRIDADYQTIDSAIDDTCEYYSTHGQTSRANSLRAFKGRVKSKDSFLTLANVYKELLNYVHITVEQRADPKETSSNLYTIAKVIKLHSQRMHDLSLLSLILDGHGWTVGTVDTWVDPTSDDPANHIKLADSVGMFEVDSQDIYSFITQNVSQFFRCIFVFDTNEYKVNVYRIESVGLDTNIFLSFHNIQNSISRSSDKQLYTVYHIQGGEELDITEANFGENWIENISYFLTTEHFSQEFINKYNTWRQYREDHRSQYMQLSVNRRNAQEQVNEIYSRVPVDGMDTAQYSTFSNDELIEERAKYDAIVKGYERRYVNDHGEYIGDDALKRILPPAEYSDFIMMRDQIIPNIDIALDNRDATSSDDTRPYLDGYAYDFDKYGDSYGVAELKAKLTTLENSINVLKEKGYDQPPEGGEEEDPYWQSQYMLYLKYTAALQSCQNAYNTRMSEYNTAVDNLENINQDMLDLKASVDINNSSFNFTNKELWLLDKYRIHTDYVNDNIITTNITTNQEYIDKAYELLQDAQIQLSADSQPQFTWQTTQDNLLIIPEFKVWHEPLEVGNFIRVSLRDDYQVKLRVITVAFNPFLIEPTIDLTFSNMVQYASTRNDFVSLMENGRSSNKNQISATLPSSSKDNTINIDSNLILKLINNGIFSSYMGSFGTDLIGGMAGEITASTITAVNATFKNLVAEEINAAYINVDHIVGNTAEFNQLFAKYIDTDYLVARIATVDLLNAGTISADSAFIQSLQSINSTSVTSIVNDTYIRNAVVNKISVADLAAGNITLSENMRILSDNGMMIMDGTALQIIGEDSQGNEYVGIQLGYDTNSQPSLILRNEEGATVLTPQGITENAIADQLIRNDMVRKGTLTKDRFAFNVMEEGDSVTIEQIFIGDKQFGAEWTTFTTGTSDALDDLSEEIQNSASYQIYIETPEGVNVRGGNIRLIAHLFRNGSEVTDEYSSSCFIWSRTSSDSAGDQAWNNAHSVGTKSLTLSGADVNITTNFTCHFYYDNGQD